MKKSLFLLPLLTAFALCGCGDNGGGGGGGGGGDTPTGKDFSITLKTTGYDASQYTYAQAPVDFEAGGVAWTTSGLGSDGKGTFGGVTQAYNPDWYAACPDGVMQLKKAAAGYVENTAAVSGFKKITIEWHATYASEDVKYFPVVSAGAASSSLSAVAADQTAKVDGTALGVKDGKEGDDKRFDVYKFTTTYTVDASAAFFRIASGASASYIAKISFSK